MSARLDFYPLTYLSMEFLVDLWARLYRNWAQYCCKFSLYSNMSNKWFGSFTFCGLFGRMGFGTGVNKYLLCGYPLSPSSIPRRQILYSSNVIMLHLHYTAINVVMNFHEPSITLFSRAFFTPLLSKIRLSCAEPGHRATISKISPFGPPTTYYEQKLLQYFWYNVSIVDSIMHTTLPGTIYLHINGEVPFSISEVLPIFAVWAGDWDVRAIDRPDYIWKVGHSLKFLPSSDSFFQWRKAYEHANMVAENVAHVPHNFADNTLGYLMCVASPQLNCKTYNVI